MLVFLPPGRETTQKAKKPEHFFDGAFFSLLLEILDPEYNPARFEHSLAASQAGEETRRSMHIIHMGLTDFARRLCPQIEPLIKTVDFQALDRDPTRVGMSEVNNPSRPPSPSSSELAPSTPLASREYQQKANIYLQVLLIFLCAACFHKDNVRYIILAQGLDAKYQSSIFQILKEIETKLNQDSVTSESEVAIATDNARVDADLAHEAAIADLQREAEEAKRQAGGLRVRLDRLQDNYDELVRKHEELQDENEQLHKQIESEAGSFDRHRLQRHLKENETLIANLENERNSLIDEKERLLKDKARLEAATQKAELLVDENQELKAKNEELSKKANMADNLRKKVEASKHLEAELTALRNDRMDLAKTYDQLTNANAKIETLKRESEAYASKMQGYEIDIANMRDQKLVLASQNQELMIRLGELEQRSQLDEAVVKDLQEKVLMLDPSAVMDDPFAARPTSLEDELNDSNNAISMRNLEVHRLQAENAVLKSTIGSETDKGQLVQEMEDLRASRQAIQDKYNDIFERFTVGQKQLDALIQNMSEKGLVETIQACYDMVPGTQWLMSDYFREEAYSNLRTQVLAEQSRSKQFERQLEVIKQQLADKERAWLEARGDCKALILEYVLNGEDADDAEKVAAVEKSNLDALTELKNTDGMLATSLRAELEAERRKYKLLKDESEAMQKQLLAAFIDKDELRREAEHANRELQKAADGHTVSTEYIKQSEKIEKLRTRYKQLHQVSHFSSSSSDSLSDEDDPDVVRMEEKRRTMWETFSPWFVHSLKSPANGFYPYETGEDGSLTVPERPVAKVYLRGGNFSASLNTIGHDSGYSSPSRMSVKPAEPTIPAFNSLTRRQKKPNVWGRWFGFGSNGSGCV
jgi:protein HOOK3